MFPVELKPISHDELLQASLRGDRIFGIILPFNSLPPMSVDVIRVDQDSVVVQHWSACFRVRAGNPRFAFWAVAFEEVCTEYRRAGWGHVFDVIDDPEDNFSAMGISLAPASTPIKPIKLSIK